MTLDQILEQIAKENNITPEIARAEMEAALDLARKSTDPLVQARWALIPKKGDTVTLEEFIDYMAALVRYRMGH